MRGLLGSLAAGLLFGFVMSRIGFTTWDEVHGMFTFAELRLLLAFMTAVGTLAVAWLVIAKLTGTSWKPRRMHPGTIAGGALFGAGWALTGACPTIAMAQLGEGQLAALWTVAGIFAGNLLYSFIHERFFRWSTDSCLDE